MLRGGISFLIMLLGACGSSPGTDSSKDHDAQVVKSTQWQSSTLCEPDETVVASEQLERGKTVSFCVENQGRKLGENAAVYRFGNQNAVELELNDVEAVRRGFSGGAEVQFIARNGAVRYVLFSNTIAGEWDSEGHRKHEFNCGLFAVRGREVVFSQKCASIEGMTGTPLGSVDPIELLPRGEFVEHFVL